MHYSVWVPIDVRKTIIIITKMATTKQHMTDVMCHNKFNITTGNSTSLETLLTVQIWQMYLNIIYAIYLISESN